MTQPCPLCASQTSGPYLMKNGFHLVRCRDCGLIYVAPMPAAADLRAHYADLGYFAGHAGQGYHDYGALHRALRPHFLRRLQRLEVLLPSRGRLLDIGCADGFFLQLAQKRGWAVAGVELSAPMAKHAARSLAAPVVSDLAELGPMDFDAITLWEVIEHLPDPLAELRRCRAHLRPGGVLMLSTPNTGHWQAQRAPEQWESYRPPSHLIYFTAATLRAAVDHADLQMVSLSRTRPLPALPAWLERRTRPLQHALSVGNAPAWPAALLLWRLARLVGWVSHRLTRSADDIFVSLEAVARRPASAA